MWACIPCIHIAAPVMTLEWRTHPLVVSHRFSQNRLLMKKRGKEAVEEVACLKVAVVAAAAAAAAMLLTKQNLAPSSTMAKTHARRPHEHVRTISCQL